MLFSAFITESAWMTGIKIHRRYGKYLNAKLSFALIMDSGGEFFCQSQRTWENPHRLSLTLISSRPWRALILVKTSENMQSVYYRGNQYSVHTPWPKWYNKPCSIYRCPISIAGLILFIFRQFQFMAWIMPHTHLAQLHIRLLVRLLF